MRSDVAAPLSLRASAAELGPRWVIVLRTAALGNENEGDWVENVRVDVGASAGEALGNSAPERLLNRRSGGPCPASQPPDRGGRLLVVIPRDRKGDGGRAERVRLVHRSRAHSLKDC